MSYMSRREQRFRELKELYVLGHSIPLARWRKRMEGDALFRDLAKGLIWQAQGQRFALEEDDCRTLDGRAFIPEGPVSLAHPVELDAPEILGWWAWLDERGIRQTFRQMREAVVLKMGKLPGPVRWVASAGKKYRMVDRYDGYRLPVHYIPALKREGFRFVVRYTWDTWDEDMEDVRVVQVAHIVTPAGVFFNCEPSVMLESLEVDEDENVWVDTDALWLRYFWPFEGVRLRTLNHVAAVMERQFIRQMAEEDDLEMLKAHLPGMTPEELDEIRPVYPEDGYIDELLTRLAHREEESPC